MFSAPRINITTIYDQLSATHRFDTEEIHPTGGKDAGRGSPLFPPDDMNNTVPRVVPSHGIRACALHCVYQFYVLFQSSSSEGGSTHIDTGLSK